MKKIILFTGGIETQEYFSLQLANAFTKIGHEIFLFDLNEEEKSFTALCNFIEPCNTIMLTFNFHGLNNEECFYQDGKIFWDEVSIPCYNIVLDHPFYYHTLISNVPPLYTHISIDLGHEAYMKRFYPYITRGPFLPLAGTEIEHKPWVERSKDIVFTGNYTPPKNFDEYITRLNEDYTVFYHGIIDDLIAHPDQDMDSVFVKHLTREMNDLSDDNLKLCMENMIFIDLYVRFYFRGLVVRTLAESGYQVHVYGGGWDLLECNYPENIILGGPLDSEGCLKVIADSKISLNVMPWFKNGAHDRVFNSMLNGALCVSDDSIWMRENIIDGEEIIYYSLKEINKLPSIINKILSNPDKGETITKAAYQKVKTFHTWDSRAKVLSNLFSI
ncbi:glycosyltransferase family protein [Anaeromicropila herbilytica]|uniref:Spore protein YkvP/CgeB glycosyl transferase-like domain-containing protein n=1 Tax=Anaeromicropila herbilytica TaxID=2785025 RepID=A0A7R7EII0_9FIRM|nr:glycosyltransferase [Anaeromicropila herbilytica]BCN29412.1 hypothetical protein bsdtb5_07070 [Anaeromicropila herbilytica]